MFFGFALALCAFTSQAHALPVLPFPTANDLAGPVFIQPFAGLAVVSEAGGIGLTQPFFSALPPGSLAGNIVANILGNFLAFDPFGNPTTFDIVGVEVTVFGSTITFIPPFGEFNFAGKPSLTFVDSVDFDVVTFLAGDFTFAFAFDGGPDLAYSYALFTTGLPIGSLLVFADVQTGVPEPSTLLLLGSGLAALAAIAWRRRRR